MTVMANRPLVGVTIGDPAGIGPEIVARALAEEHLHRAARLVVVGEGAVVRKAVDLTGVRLTVHNIEKPSQGVFSAGTLDLIDLANLDSTSLQPGVPQPQAGQAGFQFVRKAIEMAMAGEIDAIATAPLNKEALVAGHVPFIDHTAMLGKLTNSPDPMTLFVLDNLRIFFLTRHVSLAEACKLITSDLVLAGLRRAHEELKRLGMANARIAVAGLNPHAGEGGLFGREELDQVKPGVARARDEGIEAFGPIAADSVFFQNRLGKYDAVLSLYHDQGHIAAKTVDFERTVSVTLGLPFIRTSVDHGTAFDIAWKGIASARGMDESIRVATQYASLFKQATSA
jgi:4-phospho-D-threonate 3-dehydrogenase / 4-phospho-D-erythronate 3-dehydrogenase